MSDTNVKKQQRAVTWLRVLYPLWAVVGIFGIALVPSAILVSGDAAATANNIVTNELFLRLGIAAMLVASLIQVAVAIYLYDLFKVISKKASALIVIFALLGVPIAMFNVINQIAPILLQSGADYLSVFSADQLNSLSTFFLNLNTQGLVIASIFWGLWLFPLGYLAYKSSYFPKAIGVVVILAGFGYLFDSFAKIIFPGYPDAVSAILSIFYTGEIVFILWLIFRGAKLSGGNINS